MRTIPIPILCVTLIIIICQSCYVTVDDIYTLNNKKAKFLIVKDKIAFRVSDTLSYQNISTALNNKEKNQEFLLDRNLSDEYQELGIIIFESNSNINIKDIMKSTASFGEALYIADVKGEKYYSFLKNEIIVEFKDTTSQQSINQLLSRHQFETISKKRAPSRLKTILVDPGSQDIFKVTKILSKSALTNYAHPDIITKFNTQDDCILPSDFDIPQPTSEPQWYHEAMETKKTFCDNKTGDPSTVIVFIDKDFYLAHDELQPNYFDRLENQNEYATTSSHGTSVVSLAIAPGNNNLYMIGTCPECRFIPIDIRDSQGDIANALLDLKSTDDIDILSMSGRPELISANFISAFEEIGNNARNGRGAPIFLSSSYTEECLPEEFKDSGLITIVAQSNSSDEVAVSQNNENNHIDIIAPGRGYNAARYDITNPQAMGVFMGSSGSTPLVAGIAGLLISENELLTSKELHDILRLTTDKIDGVGVNYNSEGFHKEAGYGRVNAWNAFSDNIKMVINDNNISVNENFTMTIKASSMNAITKIKWASNSITHPNNNNRWIEQINKHYVKYRNQNLKCDSPGEKQIFVEFLMSTGETKRDTFHIAIN